MNKLLLFFAFVLTANLVKSQTPTASFANWKDNKKAAYTIIHDDFSAYVSGIYQYADPIATSRGIKFCFGAITHPDQCGPTEWAQARTLMSHGHECINHTHNHFCGGSASQCSGLTTYGTADFGTELGLSSQIIEANTGVKPLFFIHPYDAPSTAIENYLLGLGYLGARGGNQNAVNASSFTDFMHLNFYVWAPSSAVSSLNQPVDAAIAAGGYAIREFHGVNDPSWGSLSITNYTNHLDYVKAQMTNGNLWNATATEVITYKMQRDAYQPSVSYNAANGQIDVNFTNVRAINTSILKTPVTVNVNLNTITDNYTVSQNGLPVTFTRSGNTLTFNVYPHQGSVILNCSGCNGGGITVPDVTKLTAVPQTLSALVTWTNPPSTSFNDVLVVAKTGSGFTTKPVGTSYTANSDFTGNGAAFEDGKVVYQGAGTSLNISNLAGGQTYYIRVFVRNGTDWSNGNEVTVTIPPVIGTVPDITNLVASPQTTSALASWVNPTVSFSNVLVVIKAGSGFATKPTATTYTANADFAGNGTAFEGGKVVYQGVGTNVNIASLAAGQTYYICVFVRNGTDWSNGVQTPVTIPPVIGTVSDVTNLAVSPQATSALTSWTNPTTTNNGVLVVVKAGSGFTTKPVGTIYTARANFNGAGSVFEGGKVVYQGTGTNVTVTNLVPGQTYYMRVFVRVGTEWSNGIETSVTMPPVPNVTNLIATPQSNTAVTSWTNPTSAFNRLLVVVKAGSGFTTKPTQPISAYTANSSFTGSGTAFEGGKVVYKSTGSAITIRNLPLGATYYIRVYTLLGTEWSNGVETTVTLPAANILANLVNYNDANSVQEQEKNVLQTSEAPEGTPQYLTDKNGINSSIPYTFNIYPNPAKDRIAIDLSECEGQKVDIQILNFLGKEVYNEKIDAASPTHSININALEGGQYMLRIATQGKKATIKKLIVVH